MVARMKSAEAPTGTGHAARRGAAAYVGAYAAARIIGFAGQIYLARLLAPGAFGLYSFSLAYTALASTILDLGLTAALVARRDESSTADIAAVFWIQSMAVGAGCAASALAAPALANLLSLSPEGATLLRVFAAGVFLLSLRAVPLAYLERQLRFRDAALVELIGTAGFYGAACGAAAAGAGPIAFGYGALAWGASGAASAWILAGRHGLSAPFPFPAAADLRRIFGQLTFGLSFQGVRVFSTLRDHAAGLLAGPALSATGLGFFQVGLSYASLPMGLVNAASRVLFPAVARLSREDGTQADRVAGRAVLYATLFGSAASVALLFAAPTAIRLLYGEKWSHATDALPGLTVNMIGGYIASSIVPVFLASGRHRIALVTTVLWCAATFVLVWTLSRRDGVSGLGWAYGLPAAAAAASLLWTWRSSNAGAI